MKSDIDVEITVPSHTRFLRLVGSIGEKVAREIDCPDTIRQTLPTQLAIVLTEGLVNAIKHANSADKKKDIHVRISVSNKDLLVRIYDSGAGFNMDAVPPPRFTSSDVEDTGRGIFILKSLMDTVAYTRSDGENILEMRKKLA